MTTTSASARSHRPRSYTVFGAALVAGAAAAFGINSVLDAHLAQVQPRVESEPILVAIRPLQAGAPVTVWDVALRDWPKAMIPSSAMRLGDDIENLVVRHPLREGQPILAVQLARVDASNQPTPLPVAATVPPSAPREPEQDLWEPESTRSSSAAQVVTSQPAVAPPRVAVVESGPRAPEASSVATPASAMSSDSARMVTSESTLVLPPEKGIAPSTAAVTVPAPEASTAATPPADTSPLQDSSRPAERIAARPFPTEVPPARVEPVPPVPAPFQSAAVADSPVRPETGTQRPNHSSIQFRSVPDRSALKADANRTDFATAEDTPPAPLPKVAPPPSVLATPGKTEGPSTSPSASRQRSSTQAQGNANQGRNGQVKQATPRTGQRSTGFTKGYRSN